ncbi:MAG: ion transporter [Succinivibrio sp.]|nr:ion transporter [Succinivibrio sp.]
MIRKALEKFINHPLVEKSIMLLILTNVLLLVLSTVQEIEVITADFYRPFDFVCTIIFTIEFAIRLLVCRSFKQLFSFYMIIDFMAIAPFYMGSMFTDSAIYLRILRFSRLLRLAKLARYSKALKNIERALRHRKEELFITFSVFGVCVIISGILMYVFEHAAQPDVFSSVPRSCYFAIVTFTTVGYGDFSPVTEEGRIITSVMAIVGVCIHGLLVGVIGSAMNAALRLDRLEPDEDQELQELEALEDKRKK